MGPGLLWGLDLVGVGDEAVFADKGLDGLVWWEADGGVDFETISGNGCGGGGDGGEDFIWGGLLGVALDALFLIRCGFILQCGI